MNALIDLPWRVYPASALIIGGLVVAIFGLRLAVAAIRRPHQPVVSSLNLLRGFRYLVIGICVAHIGAAWNWQILWPLMFALVFLGEEMLEISFMIGTVQRDRHQARA